MKNIKSQTSLKLLGMQINILHNNKNKFQDKVFFILALVSQSSEPCKVPLQKSDQQINYSLNIGIIIQMSYHYRQGNKADEIRRQLNELQMGLESDHKSLDRLKLEAQFYEDKGKQIANDKMSLADEIMNELISAPPAQPAIPKNYLKQQAEPIPYLNKIDSYKPTPVAPPPPAYVAQNERQNNFINDREIQKIKMQNQKHEGLFPSSSDHNRVRSFGKQAQPIPQNDSYSPKAKQQAQQPFKKPQSPDAEKNYNPDFNPFVRADELQKQKREESHRQYLKELQLQRQQQEKIKEEREKQKKLMKGQFFDFLPAPAKNEPEKPIVKKIDPNSKPPKIEIQMGNYSQFDSNLIRSKAIEIKSKYKKGKITFEECERELNNLRKQYNGNLDDLLSDNTSATRSEKQPQVEPSSEKLKLYKQESPKKQFYEQQGLKENNMNSFPIKNESINYSQFMPSMVPQQQPQKASQFMMGNPMMNTMSGMAPVGAPTEYMQLMKKMFEVCMKEVKEAYSHRLDQQDKAYQETLNKFLIHSQNNFMTQQIPPIQASQQQKQFYSDAKQMKELFENKESNIKKKNLISGQSLANIPFGESDNSEYYDKSLSGIASKIPYNTPTTNVKLKPKTEKQEKILKQSGVQQFYNRKYKVKKLQRFTFLSQPNQTTIQIPSTSTYLRTKNALEELQIRFHQDLAELKRMQSQKSTISAAIRMTKNTAYTSERRVLKDSSGARVQSGNTSTSRSPLNINQPQAQENPFLKKHVSNDDNMMTFNEKELRMGSPINSYSPKSKKEILEQDQYQTEPRVRQEIKVPSYIQEYQQRLKMPNKALNFIKMNNEALNKYQKTQKSKKQAIMIRDQSDYRQKQSNYFTNNDISPVKKNENYYEESLQTIRSDFQSAQHSKRPHKIIDSASQLPHIAKSLKRSLQKQQQAQGLSNVEMIGYSQTVQSIEESSIKNSRPPVAKKRQLSKKKESSIARSKLNPDSSVSRAYNESIEHSEVPKFDSNVYESQYEESAVFQRVTAVNPQMVKNSSIERAQDDPNIQIYAPTIVAPRSALQIQGNYSSYEQKTSSAKVIQPQGKLKSLQQARKLAKEYRAKATDQSKQYKSVEERFSELESFMTKRGDESIQSIRRQPERPRQKSKEKSAKGKRDIMKMLEQLQDDQQDYKQDFQSYREESQQYQ